MQESKWHRFLPTRRIPHVLAHNFSLTLAREDEEEETETATGPPKSHKAERLTMETIFFHH